MKKILIYCLKRPLVAGGRLVVNTGIDSLDCSVGLLVFSVFLHAVVGRYKFISESTNTLFFLKKLTSCGLKFV